MLRIIHLELTQLPLLMLTFLLQLIEEVIYEKHLMEYLPEHRLQS